MPLGVLLIRHVLGGRQCRHSGPVAGTLKHPWSGWDISLGSWVLPSTEKWYVAVHCKPARYVACAAAGITSRNAPRADRRHCSPKPLHPNLFLLLLDFVSDGRGINPTSQDKSIFRNA